MTNILVETPTGSLVRDTEYYSIEQTLEREDHGRNVVETEVDLVRVDEGVDAIDTRRNLIPDVSLVMVANFVEVIFTQTRRSAR